MPLNDEIGVRQINNQRRVTYLKDLTDELSRPKNLLRSLAPSRKDGKSRAGARLEICVAIFDLAYHRSPRLGRHRRPRPVGRPIFNLYTTIFRKPENR